MGATPTPDVLDSASGVPWPVSSVWNDAWHQFARHRLAMVGLFTFVALVLFTLLGPILYRTGIGHIDFTGSLEGPSLEHLFGLDDLGRDMLARAMLGGRISIAVGVTSMLLAITLGMTIGAMAGFFAKLDGPLMRLTDLFLSMPVLPLLLVIVYLFRDALRAVFGPELGIFLMIVGVIGILQWMPVARVVRASFLSLKEQEFVVGARAIGAGNLRIITRHIMPNVLSSMIAAATIGVASAIITESTLSFLGLGFPSDTPTWGRLLFDAKDYIDVAPHWPFFPGMLIFLTVLSINFIGDGLRDALDPRKTFNARSATDLS